MEAKSLPGPGIYAEDMPAELYHELPYASNSRLSKLHRSPAHMKADMDGLREVTDALRRGTAIHTAVLEPHIFSARYVTAGQCAASKKDGNQCSNGGTHRIAGHWFCGVKGHSPGGDFDDVETLSEADAAMCKGIVGSLSQHGKIRRLLESEGPIEVSVIWDDEETGVRCKARMDKLCRISGRTIILDLKTTEDARPDAFERSIFNFGYHRQVAFYREGLAANGIEATDLVIAAAEKSAPWASAAYRMMPEAVDMGAAEVRKLLARWAECQRTGIYPAYGEDITEIGLPSWAWSKMENAA